MTRLVTALFALAVAALAMGGVQAAQDDPRLGPLFDRLTVTSDAEEAAILTALIWGHWQHHDDPAVARQMRIGVHATERGNLGMALTAFDTVVELAPEFAEGWNKRATLHYLAGNLNASLADVRQTLVLEPRHFGALAGLGISSGRSATNQGRCAPMRRGFASTRTCRRSAPRWQGCASGSRAIRPDGRTGHGPAVAAAGRAGEACDECDGQRQGSGARNADGGAGRHGGAAGGTAAPGPCGR